MNGQEPEDDSVRAFLKDHQTEPEVKTTIEPVAIPDPLLTKSQIEARAVLELLPELRTQAKKRQGRRGLENGAKAHILAGKAVGVGGGIISDASVIQRESPELFQKILNGELAVNTAWRRLKALQSPPSPSPPGPRKPAQRQIDYAKRKMIEVLWQIRGLCRALSMMNIDMITAGLSTRERHTWIGISREISSELRTFRQRLE